MPVMLVPVEPPRCRVVGCWVVVLTDHAPPSAELSCCRVPRRRVPSRALPGCRADDPRAAERRVELVVRAAYDACVIDGKWCLMPDTPAVARRREREMRTISQMIALYCTHNHKDAARTQRAHCGEPVCQECAELDAYAAGRTERCRKMDVKTSCEECGNHCYRPEERERICTVMRYAGPRMLTHHPIAAVRHLLGK